MQSYYNSVLGALTGKYLHIRGELVHSITTSLLWFFFAGNLMIFVIFGYLALRPNRAKVFFSYSHKDTELAERLMARLKGFHFRIWIDLGVVIPPYVLEKKLSKLIKNRQIFLLLASRHSVESSWVQFEIEQAKEQGKFLFSKWRDTVVLALDEQGVQLYKSLKKAFDDFVIHSHAKKFGEEDQAELAALSEVIARYQGIKALPFFRRALVPTITLIDLQQPFEAAMEQLSEYLILNSRMGRVKPEMRKTVKGVFIAFMIYSFIITSIAGILLLYSLGYI